MENRRSTYQDKLGTNPNQKLSTTDDVARFAAQSKSAGTVTVADFLYNFLKSKYGVPAAIAEAGYNLIDALTRYQVRKKVFFLSLIAF